MLEHCPSPIGLTNTVRVGGKDKMVSVFDESNRFANATTIEQERVMSYRNILTAGYTGATVSTMSVNKGGTNPPDIRSSIH
jgi:hypothetical protein